MGNGSQNYCATCSLHHHVSSRQSETALHTLYWWLCSIVKFCKQLSGSVSHKAAVEGVLDCQCSNSSSVHTTAATELLNNKYAALEYFHDATRMDRLAINSYELRAVLRSATARVATAACDDQQQAATGVPACNTKTCPNKGRLCVEREKSRGLQAGRRRRAHGNGCQCVSQQHCVWCGSHGVVSWCSNALLCGPSGNGHRHLSVALELQQRLHAMGGSAWLHWETKISDVPTAQAASSAAPQSSGTSICVAAIHMLAAQAACFCSTGHAL